MVNIYKFKPIFIFNSIYFLKLYKILKHYFISIWIYIGSKLTINDFFHIIKYIIL
jgi:hypothetical protein